MQIMRLLTNSVMTDNSTIGFIIVDSQSINLTFCVGAFIHTVDSPSIFS
jgi:hypothetical protein